MKILIVVHFPKANRIIHFSNVGFSDEYDQLTLDMEEIDKREKYQHLAGESFIPNEKGVVLTVRLTE